MKRILLILIASLSYAVRFGTIWSKMEFPADSVTPFIFGRCNCGIGDVNGDGYDDFLVDQLYGSDCTDTTAANRVFLFLGRGMNIPIEPDLTFEHRINNTGHDGYGTLVMNGLGDVNGDGYDDFAVCAHYAITDTMPWGEIAHGGKVYVYFGSPFPDTVPDLIFKGDLRPYAGSWENGTFASAVCGADMNGDGYNDIIIGSSDYRATMGQYPHGRVYIFFGGPAIDTFADITITSSFCQQLGFALDNLGDVNGDGYDDIIVGAPNNSEYAAAAGKAYLFYGGNPMDTIPDWWYYGEDTLQVLGEVVSNAGDFNGDGYKDIMIGDYMYKEGFNYIGRAIVFFGGPDLDTIPDWQVTGGLMPPSLNLGSGGVDCIGDVNGDGYDDIVIGNPAYKVAGCQYGEFGGRVILYYGGESPNTIPDIQHIGTLPYEKSVGWNTCSAGDVNGDGINEVIFGTNYPPIVPYPDVYGWVRVMKITEAALPESLRIACGDCYVLVCWQGKFEEETSLYQLLKNDLPDTAGWYQVASMNPNNSGFYTVIDRDVQFSKAQYYWLKVYTHSGDFDVYGPYEGIPVPLQTMDFSAYFQIGGSVRLKWQVQGGDICGYNLYREKNSIREKINPTLIPSETTEYLKCGIEETREYNYWLGILQTSQDERLIGPVLPDGIISINPNPFRDRVKLGVRISKHGIHILEIYNILGQKVKTIWHDELEAGYHEAVWDGRDDENRNLPAGVYYCRYKMGNLTNTAKIVLLK
jgi:hypothetical protein